MLYDKLLTLEKLPPPTAEKKLLSYGIAKENLNKIYLLPFTATQEVKLAMFQHKIIHNILATNSILYKMKKVASPSCPFCPSDSQNIRHLFISCPQASSFWYKFQSWYSTVSKRELTSLWNRGIIWNYSSLYSPFDNFVRTFICFVTTEIWKFRIGVELYFSYCWWGPWLAKAWIWKDFDINFRVVSGLIWGLCHWQQITTMLKPGPHFWSKQKDEHNKLIC